ncbi:MAG: FMN-binding glutamate synthase family protein [Acidobacteriota bacterium]|nr:MAG: FMN-binding glutamate synthase family protein [Acidobacteriota bacterium]
MTGGTIGLHGLSRFTNRMIVVLAAGFLAAGVYVSFWFHFLTVFFILLTVMNFFYRHVQTRHAVLRNFGILGQARYVIESVGPELRQYLFASDTEERPFNRHERSEVYRKAKGIDSAVSFGSQAAYDSLEIKIRHSLYPTDSAELEPFRLVLGEERGIAARYTLTKPVMISAMSFGALGEPAVRALGRGAGLAGIPMNTGEGGYPKHHLAEGCDLIFQMGTAKFGIRDTDGRLDEEQLRALAGQDAVKMVEIKFSQGAKPGKGGLLPKEKITREISELRGVPMGRDVISPPFHDECRDVGSTVRFIRRVQDVTELPVGIKTCVGSFAELRTLFEEMKSRDVYPDYISIDGGEGGTGAAPKAYIDGFGVPLLPALHGVQRLLRELGIRDRMKLFAAGKLISSYKWVVAMSLGADAVYTARGFMLALGCIQTLQCGNNTCPVGITTHDPILQRGLVIEDKAARVANYAQGVVHDFEALLCSVGVRSARELTIDNLYIPPASILAREALT